MTTFLVWSDAFESSVFSSWRSFIRLAHPFRRHRHLPRRHGRATMSRDRAKSPTTMYGLASPRGQIELEETRTFSFDKEKHREKDHYTWAELNRLEQRRRAILKRVELPFRQIIFYWDGTCLRALARDWLIWVTILLYVTIRALAWADIVPEVVNELGSRDTGHVAGYTGLSKTYSKTAFFDEMNKRLKLLTPKEMIRMDELDMDHGSDAAREIWTWCMKEVQVALDKEFIDHRVAGTLRENVLSVQEHMDNLYAFTDQPVHFYYIHFLCLISALYLPLFALSNAYSAGFGDDIHLTTDFILGLIVLIQAFFVIGLRLLGQQMVDPYGDDLEDLSVLYYIWSTAAATKNILNAKYPDDIDPKLEVDLARGQVPLNTNMATPAESFTNVDNTTGTFV